MAETSDFDWKIKRDVLVISTLIIYVNLAKVEFDQFTVFGITAHAHSPVYAYLILWAMWLYFSYRFFVQVLDGKEGWFGVNSDDVNEAVFRIANQSRQSTTNGLQYGHPFQFHFRGMNK